MKKIIAGIVLGLMACVVVGCGNEEMSSVEAPTTDSIVSTSTSSEKSTTETTTTTTDTIATITTTTNVSATTETSTTNSESRRETEFVTELTENSISAETTEVKIVENENNPRVVYAMEIEITTPTEKATTTTTSAVTTNTESVSTETSKVETSTDVTTTLKSIDEIAEEVWAGKWGSNEERKTRLTEAGYDYRAVQDRVNELASEYQAKNDTSTNVSSNGVKLGNFRITGYVATGNKTASGTWPSAGRTIAMNKSQKNDLGLNWGDRIYIEGLGTYTLEDCGCKYGVIDVFCNTVSQCYALTSYANAYKVN